MKGGVRSVECKVLPSIRGVLTQGLVTLWPRAPHANQSCSCTRSDCQTILENEALYLVSRLRRLAVRQRKSGRRYLCSSRPVARGCDYEDHGHGHQRRFTYGGTSKNQLRLSRCPDFKPNASFQEKPAAEVGTKPIANGDPQLSYCTSTLQLTAFAKEHQLLRKLEMVAL